MVSTTLHLKNKMLTAWIYSINGNDGLFNEPKKITLQNQQKEPAIKEISWYLAGRYGAGTRVRIFKKNTDVPDHHTDIWNGVWNDGLLKEG